MHEVRFEPSGLTLRVPAGTRLLEAVRTAGLPVARACRGSGLCGRCGLAVDGPLEPESPGERRARERNRVREGLRLACCITVHGDLRVRATYW